MVPPFARDILKGKPFKNTKKPPPRIYQSGGCRYVYSIFALRISILTVNSFHSLSALAAEFGAYLMLRRQCVHIVAGTVGVRVLAEGRSLTAGTPGSTVLFAVA